MDITRLNLKSKLEIVILKVTKILPAEMGQQLMAMLTPQTLAIMAGVIVLWSGAHFMGIGEIADLILLIVGWAAVGGVAIEAAKKLYDFAIKTYEAKTDRELDEAADDLAQAIALLGVNTVMAILLKKNPKDTFRTSYRNVQMPTYSNTIKRAMNAPRNSSPGWRYRPKIRFTDRLEAGRGSTNLWGDIVIGRRFDPSHRSAQEATKDMLTAFYHEKVHSFIAPRFYLLRELRAFTRQSALNKSYLLRYLEEAFAETIGLMRSRGMSSRYIVDGFKFPLATNYEITFTALRHEAAGILLGPVIVGGVMYNVYYGMQL